MTITAIEPPGSARRAAAINGLANLSAFIETHPDLPLSGEWSGDPFTVYSFAGTDEENRAEVDRIAGILGVTPGWMPGSSSHYTVVRQFGGGVNYRALAIDSRYKSAAVPAGTGAAA